MQRVQMFQSDVSCATSVRFHSANTTPTLAPVRFGAMPRAKGLKPLPKTAWRTFSELTTRPMPGSQQISQTAIRPSLTWTLQRRPTDDHVNLYQMGPRILLAACSTSHHFSALPFISSPSGHPTTGGVPLAFAPNGPRSRRVRHSNYSTIPNYSDTPGTSAFDMLMFPTMSIPRP